MDAGVGEAAVAEGAKAATEVGSALATETGLTAGGANIAALNTLGPAGVATYSAMETVAGLGAIPTVAAGAVTASNILNTAKTVATIASPISSVIQAASGASAVKKGITNATGSPIVAPQVTAPVTMPTFGSQNTLNALRSNIQEQLVRRGRAATILTSPSASSDKLGS